MRVVLAHSLVIYAKRGSRVRSPSIGGFTTKTIHFYACFSWYSA